jgi:hypothetical protein
MPVAIYSVLDELTRFLPSMTFIFGLPHEGWGNCGGNSVLLRAELVCFSVACVTTSIPPLAISIKYLRVVE